MKTTKEIHKAIKREMEYVSMDCYGYTLTCACGLKIHEWHEKDCEDKFKEHQKVKNENNI